MKKVSATAARRMNADLDKIATTIEKHHERLGIPEKVAKDFAYRCDLLSDRIAKVAGFNPSTIGKPVEGPLEMKTPTEPWMDGHFTQDKYEQLSRKQDAGKLDDGKADPPVDGTQVAKTAQELAKTAAKLANLLSRKAGEEPKEEKPEEKKGEGEPPKPEEKPEEKKAGEEKKPEEKSKGDEYDLDE